MIPVSATEQQSRLYQPTRSSTTSAAAADTTATTTTTTTTTGDTIYVLHGLDTDDDLIEWANFCASIFAYKANPPPREYFLGHYYNDPDRTRPSLIRVASIQSVGASTTTTAAATTTTTTNSMEAHPDPRERPSSPSQRQIVASCRIFLRAVTAPSTTTTTTTYGRAGEKRNGLHGTRVPLPGGGIGEVCTHPNHRNRGLSKQLLLDCFAIMTELSLSITLLHAAPHFVSFYRAMGYCSTTTEWKVITWDNYLAPVRGEEQQELLESLSSSPPSLTATTTSVANVMRTTTRLAQFPKDSQQLHWVHQNYSENRFVGCIHRSEQYWSQYVSQELKNSLWILEYQHEHRSDDSMECGGNEDSKVTILGWLSVRPRLTDQGTVRYQVREFGCTSVQDARYVMERLLPFALPRDSNTPTVTLALPKVVWDDIQNSGHSLPASSLFHGGEVSDETDHGWMYKQLNASNDAASTFLEKIHVTTEHLIWPTDSF